MTMTAGGAYRRRISEHELDGDDPNGGRREARGTVTSRRRHDVIVGNIVGELRGALRDMPCEVYPAGLRVRGQADRVFAPDVTVVCQVPRFHDAAEDVLLNPTILFEVISEATEAEDRGDKFEGYASIATVAEYVLVSAKHQRVERFVRHADGSWTYRAYGAGELVPLSTAGCQLKVDEVYLKAFPK